MVPFNPRIMMLKKANSAPPVVHVHLILSPSISPLSIVYSRSEKQFPPGQSVNCGIPRPTYLEDSFTLRLPGLDAILDIIRFKGPHCHLFKLPAAPLSRFVSTDAFTAH